MTKERKEKWTCIFLGALAIYILLLINNVTEFYYDSEYYWALSQRFYDGDRFIFEAGDFGYRGYAYPLFLAVVNGAGTFSKYIYWTLLSLIYSILIVGVVGDLVEAVMAVRVSAFKRLIPLLLLLIFWRGLFVYPLTDLITVLVSVTAVYFICLLIQNKSIYKDVLYVFAAGALSYCALDIRATYKWNIYLSLVMIIIICWKSGWKRTLGLSVFFAIGVGVLAVPQIYSNYVRYNALSYDNPLVLYRANQGLGMSFLLFEGEKLLRYETYVGVGSGETILPGITGYDPIMSIILAREGVDLSVPDTLGIIKYIKMFFKYPIEYLQMYFAHLVNCLDARYGEIYIKEFGNRYHFQVLSVVIYLITLIDVRIKLISGRLQGVKNSDVFLLVCRRYGLVIMYILLPAIISLPGHIEPRYAIALHLLIYAYIAYCTDYKAVSKWVKGNICEAIILFLVLFFGLSLIQNWSLTMAGYENFLF